MPRKNPLDPIHARSHAGRPGQSFVLRIIGGEWRGRKIRFPPVQAIRPTPDRVRETLFNWLQDVTPGSRCLDLYAGSGAIGLEALSRGASEVVFVDVEPAVVRHLGDILREFACDPGRSRTVRADARAFLAQPGTPFDVIFLDPPFAAPVLPELCRLIEVGGWLRRGGLVYLEAPVAAGEPDLPPGWTLLKSKRAGEVGYHLARRDVADQT